MTSIIVLNMLKSNKKSTDSPGSNYFDPEKTYASASEMETIAWKMRLK